MPSFLTHLYNKIFGQAPSQAMEKFFRNLSWSFLGGGIAAVIMLGVNIWAGKIIGPEGYGKYSLVLVISQIFMMLVFFGLDQSSIRSIAKSKDKQEEAKNISSPFYFIIFTLVLLSIVFWLTFQPVANRFSIDQTLLIMALVYTIVISLKTILDCSIRGLQLFRYQFVARMIEVGLIAAVFYVYFFLINANSYIYYIYVLMAGALGLIIFYLKKLIPYLFHFRFSSLKKQLSYGKILLLGAVLGTAFNTLDKLIIAKYLNVFQLGIYGAYFTASTNLIAQATQMFVNVFFPTASKLKDRRFTKKLDKIFSLGFIPALIILSALIYFIMRLFGAEYGVNLIYVFSFGFLATLQIILTINSATITAISKDLFKKYIFWLNIINVIHIVAYGVIIYLGMVSILGIVWLLVVNVSVSILMQRRLINFSMKEE